jgi:thymidylate synthase (FAD)
VEEFNGQNVEKESIFRDDVTVELIDHCLSDSAVTRAARVSTLGNEAGVEREDSAERGLINFLMRERHGSPFEHGSVTFRTEAPIFVFREHHRHRIASYNEESGRYKELEPVFYVPNNSRNLVQQGKAGAYEYVPGSPEQHQLVVDSGEEVARFAYEKYQEQLKAGIAREVARMVLPVSIFSTCYVTMNPRGLMNFLSLRVKSEDSTHKSYPQREIEMVAEEYEKHFAELMPMTHEAFIKNGRVAP